MQQRLAAEGLPRSIRILGINAVGHDRDNHVACAGRTLPWLQDTASANVWGSWQAVWRDVIILDADNRATAVYNLTTRDLADPFHRQALEALLRDAARR